MGVTVEVLETATVATQMRKEPVIEPDVNPFPAALGALDIQFTKYDTKPQRSQVLLLQGHRARKSWKINLPQLSGPSACQLPALAE